MRKSLHHLQPNRAVTLRLCGIAGLAIGILGTSTASAQTARERDNDQPERRSSLDQRGPVRNNNNNQRNGDRFWYESYLPRDMVRLVERQTLDVIIRRNTDIGDKLQENAFLIQPECVADVNHDGVLTPADFSAWVSAFNEQEPECDQNQDGQCTAADYTAWVANYNAGC